MCVVRRIGLAGTKLAVATGGTIQCKLLRVAVAGAFDTNGRPLPRWRGCTTLTIGDVFLISRCPAVSTAATSACFVKRRWSAAPGRCGSGRADKRVT
jgi:type IV secretory pathway protease TraF